MKILHLCTHVNVGGISSYIMTVGSKLIERGHEVHLGSGGGDLFEDFSAKGFKTAKFGLRTKNEFHPKLLFTVPSIAAYVKRNKIDLIHAHTRVSQVAAFFVSKAAGVPYVTTAHGFYRPRFFRRKFGCWGVRTVAISPMVAESLENEHKLPSANIRVIQNAVDIKTLRARIAQQNIGQVRQKYGINKGDLVISAIGRLVTDKGHDFLIEAARELKKSGMRIFLLILGDGRERERLNQLIDKNRLRNHVRILSREKGVARVLSITDIFVHPATYREGFGLSIAEAMVAGKPVIVTDIPAINRIIRDQHTGLVVDPKSVVALETAIRYLIKNPDHRRVLANNGCRMATELCSPDRMADEFEKLYTEVTGVPTSRAKK